VVKQRNLPGEPMDLGNMRKLGVQRLVAYYEVTNHGRVCGG
jgi:hypothetical protein